MNRKLSRVLDEIQRTEGKIAEWQEHLKGLNERRRQMEDAEIVKSIRSMKLTGQELMKMLEGIQNGTVSFQYAEENPDTDVETYDTEEHTQMQNEIVSESEGFKSEEKN